MTDTSAASAARELPLEPGGTVEITVSSGDLRIRGTDGDRVVVRTRDGEPLDGVSLEGAPGVVRVRGGSHVDVRLGPVSFRTGGSPDLDLDVPRWAAIALRTVSGDVEATGIGGASRWASASGDLRLAVTAGPVQLETMSGEAMLDASGALDLGARTVSGDIRVRATRLETTDVGSTSGDIRIEADLAAAGRHAISSVSGDVEIATASPVRLEAQTITGDVRADGPHTAEGGRGRRRLVVGDGSVGLSVRTTSGDVRLRTRDPRVAGAAPGPVAGAAPEPVAPRLAPEPPIAPVAPIAPIPPMAPESPGAPPMPEPPSPAPMAPTPAEAPSAAPAGWDASRAAADVPLRPITDDDTQAWSAAQPLVDRREAARLDILRALERGDLDLETASRRLEILEEAGPRFFRGWC